MNKFFPRLTFNLIVTSFLLSVSLPTAFAKSKVPLDKLPAYSTQYDIKRDPFKDGAAAVKLATETNRRILIELGGEWCSWCHKMDAFFDSNPDLKQKLHDTFVMLKVNVSSENNNAEFLKAFPRPNGYPHMYVSDKNGSVLYSQDTGSFVNKGQYSREAFLTFFERWNIENKEKK